MKPNNRVLWIQGGLYTTIAALTPVASALMSDVTLTTRYMIALVMAAIIAGATALKAFLSTTFSESPASDAEPTVTKLVTDDNKPVTSTNPLPTDPK